MWWAWFGMGNRHIKACLLYTQVERTAFYCWTHPFYAKVDEYYLTVIPHTVRYWAIDWKQSSGESTSILCVFEPSATKLQLTSLTIACYKLTFNVEAPSSLISWTIWTGACHAFGRNWRMTSITHTCTAVCTCCVVHVPAEARTLPGPFHSVSE